MHRICYQCRCEALESELEEARKLASSAVDFVTKQRDELLAAAEKLLSAKRPGQTEDYPRLILEVDCLELEKAVARAKGGV